MGPDDFTMWLAERIAEQFHNAYEAYAPSHGYETRKASRVAWENVPEANKALMTNTVAHLLQQGVIYPPMREGYFILNGAPGPGAMQLLVDAIRKLNEDPNVNIDVAMETELMKAVAHPGDFVEFEVITEEGNSTGANLPAMFDPRDAGPVVSMYRMGPVYVPHLPDAWTKPTPIEHTHDAEGVYPGCPACGTEDHDLARHGAVEPDDPEAPSFEVEQSQEGVPSLSEEARSAAQAHAAAQALDARRAVEQNPENVAQAMKRATAVWPSEQEQEHGQ